MAFYAVFLYTYLLYRYKSTNYLTYAILSAALPFYSYNPGQLVVVLTGILLLLSDARYHWQNRKEVLYGLGLVAVLAIPYLRFSLSHPAVPLDHLRKLGSYWVQPLPLSEKWAHYWSEYLYGLSPAYWFLPNGRDLPRHLMKGYGNLLRVTLPFAAFGFFLAVKEIRSPANRAILIALFADLLQRAHHRGRNLERPVGEAGQILECRGQELPHGVLLSAAQELLRRYVHALVTQIAQSGVCNRFHNIDARLARWLLMTHDRMGSDELHATQESIAHMLGVPAADEEVHELGGSYPPRGLQRPAEKSRRDHRDVGVLRRPR